MIITELREELVQARERMLRGDRAGAMNALDRALGELDAGRLLTTTEAASLLGIRSVNTLKLLLRREGIPTVQRGNRTLVPLGEVERLQCGDRVRDLRASDRLHDSTAPPGEDPISPEVLGAIAADRPGMLPWDGHDRT
jgi:hypothetical protein